MFDKLIESEPEGADFKNRRSYFMVSSIVVGLLFMTAVVISIYAADIGLGNSNFELVEVLPVADVVPAETEPVKHQPRTSSNSQSETTRTVNMSRTDEPTIVPTNVSTAPNTTVSRPDGRFIIGKTNADAGDPGTSGRDPGGNSPVGNGLAGPPTVTDPPKETDPPRIKETPVKNVTQSLGVINGIASYLPKPAYPSTAIAMHIEGKVDIQVTVDETGKVISARALSGHPLLTASAVKAAWSARFTPTYLSHVPVKVTGMIVYNFAR